jgi:hypothetical protein
MMNDWRTRLIITIVIFTALIVITVPVYSQDRQKEPATRESWLDNLIGLENSGIINGIEYKMDFLGASSDPFFFSEAKQGTIRYNEALYVVPLLYDIYKDEIIVRHFSANGRVWFVQLDKKLVERFSISGHTFRNFDRGFHELIYDGDDFLVVARRTKVDEVKNRIVNYIRSDEFFMIHHGAWKRFSHLSALTSLLSSKEETKDLKKFVKENNISSRKFSSEDIVKVATFVKVLRSGNRK